MNSELIDISKMEDQNSSFTCKMEDQENTQSQTIQKPSVSENPSACTSQKTCKINLPANTNQKLSEILNQFKSNSTTELLELSKLRSQPPKYPTLLFNGELLGKGTKIGQGGFSKVYLQRYHSTAVARKKLLFFSMENFSKEFRVVSSIRHPNIPRFMGVTPEEDSISIVSEYIKGENLDKYLPSDPPLLVKTLLMLDLARTMLYLHGFNVIHRDLKPNNMIVDEDLNLRLLDFGISKLSDRTRTTTMLKGTVSYMAPENFGICNVMKGTTHVSAMVDVWAFGCILNEAFGEFNLKPWKGEDNDNAIMGNLILGSRLPINRGIHNVYIRSLIKACTKVSPYERVGFRVVYYYLLLTLGKIVKENGLGDLFDHLLCDAKRGNLALRRL